MKKTKIIAAIAVSFVVFATTLFALAQSQTSNSLFLDSDQDGLSNKEETAIGTNPNKPDTDGDGYTDRNELLSGYNPLKAAPGDKMTLTEVTAIRDEIKQAQPDDQALIDSLNSTIANLSLANNIVQNTATGSAVSTANQDLAGSASNSAADSTGASLNPQALSDLSSDPNNPNLTNEMIGQLLQLTNNKAATDTSFADNPTYSSSDIANMTQGALQTVDITQNMPVIKDSDLNILPAVNDKKLSADEIKAKQKSEIETYLAQVAFIMAANSPFPVDQPANLQSQVNTESTNFVSALASGDTTKIASYATKAQAGIDQMKKVAVPYVLKDIDKSMLHLAIYTLGLKDQITLNAADPMKSLAAASSLQAVAQKSMDLQSQLSQILTSYGIDTINFPS